MAGTEGGPECVEVFTQVLGLFDDTLNWDSSLFHWLSDASIWALQITAEKGRVSKRKSVQLEQQIYGWWALKR